MSTKTAKRIAERDGPRRKDGTPTSLVGEAKNAKTGVRAVGSWRHAPPPNAIPGAPSMAERVNVIADAMRRLQWRASHADDYSKAWGVSGESVRHAIAEAHRRVAAEVQEPSRATATVVTHLEAALEAASAMGDLRAVGDLSRTWSAIVGAVAPARVQVTALVADLSKLSADDLRSKAEELTAAVGKRLALSAATPDMIMSAPVKADGEDGD